MVVGTNPGCCGDHGDNRHDDRDNTPCQSDRGSIVGISVLEGADDSVYEPDDPGCGATGVDTTNVLDEARQEDAPPERSPLGELSELEIFLVP